MNRCTVACVLVVSLLMPGCRDERSTPPVITPSAPAPATQSSGPAPTLTPDAVVRLVMEALARNDHPAADAGIATAFSFASPGNKQLTGPLSRFIPMVKTPLYQPLLNHATIDYGPIRVDGVYAEQLVTVTSEQGEPAAFLFTLSRQAEGEYEDCWMTDGVTRIGAEPIPPEPAERREQETPQITI